MKKIKIIAVLLMVFIAGMIQAQSQEVILPFSKPSAEKKLNINLSAGKISIKGTSRQDVLVKYTVQEERDKEEKAEEKFNGMKKISGSNLSFEMGEENNQAYIESTNWFTPMDLQIEVPMNIQLKISNNMGEEIMVENVTGNINVESNMGSVHLNNISGVANVSSNVGSIKVIFKDIPSPKNMLFTTTMGDVDITLPSNLGADLKLKTDWGEVYSDMDIEVEANTPQVRKIENGNKVKVVKENWTSGKINGGGVGITLKTKMGDILIRQK